MRWSLPPNLSWPHFGIAARWGIHLRFIIWEEATLLLISFFVFLSSNFCTTWAANFTVLRFLSVFLRGNACTIWAANFVVFILFSVFLSSNVCIIWAAMFPFILKLLIICCLSLSFSSCLFLPDLLHYLFPYLFICGTVKVIQI